MERILITGASRGIGREIAISSAKTGRFDHIILNCRSSEALLDEVAQAIYEINPSIRCSLSLGDVGDYSYIQELHEQYGDIDVLINNAAISLTGLLIDMTPEEWQSIISTNITSIYNTCHEYLPAMISAKSGQIINISSVWGIAGASCEVAYSATKGAINAFTKALAKEVAPSNIQVNALALGIVDTTMNSHLSKEDINDICEDIPIGRMLRPEEVGDTVTKLLQMPTYLTGEVITIDGGWI
ncbi:MAG: SDR family NAD(P)-dependent oxidoreductase [Eubacterium sp.]|nr:SDR family NAD(P)-dependent oxidoreductase [Eubacterium sp.]